MDCLTGGYDANDSTTTPGLLSSAGLTNKGGYISIKFDLKSTAPYSYAGKSDLTDIGTMSVHITVTKDDTEASILSKINDALNDSVVIDFYSSNYGATHNYANAGYSSLKYSMADKDVFKDNLTFNNVDLTIHSGPTANDKIDISYKCLRVEALGMLDTNLLTEDDARDAIDEVTNALSMVSKQRSLFGAYQNRMEHAMSINNITAENTTAAESRIRDTEMADEIVKHAKESILMQTAQAMLSQANGSPESILTLLK